MSRKHRYYLVLLAAVLVVSILAALVCHNLMRRSASSPVHAEDAYYSNGLLHLHIQLDDDGALRAELRSAYKDFAQTRMFSVQDPSGVIQAEDVELTRVPARDAVIVRWAKINTEIYRFDREEARRTWRALCAHAQAGRRAFQQALDVWQMQVPEYVWWAATERVHQKRYARFTMHMAQLGVDISCPALDSLWASEEARLVAASGAHGCTTDGKLTPENERCVASSDEDCLVSRICTYFGQCSARDGECLATEYDCTRSLACRHEGRCTFNGGRCVVGVDDCARSYLCMRVGNCALDAVGGRCVPRSEEDCRQSMACATGGVCHFDGSACARPVREGGP